MFPENTINLVITQTNYNRDTAIKKLEKWNGDAIKVVKEYLNPNFQKTKKENPNVSTNQQIMSSIRNFMDDVYKNYEKRKTQKEKKEEEKKKSIIKEKKMKKTLELIDEINEEEEEEEDQNIEISEINH
tara:strand:+ start:780 stop:1166 length:387 start_codon:yes stop_codon:yes gene_type:complete